MCGIVGYIGRKQALLIMIDGLRRLEYRGYDSAGVAIFDGQKINCQKSIGRLSDLEAKIKGKNLDGDLGIAHTRWATHGEPSEINAHPHFDCGNQIAVVHNGIIENYDVLKNQLEKEGHKFRSKTDTEVLAHLIEKYYKKKKDLTEAIRLSLSLIKGTYGICVICQDEPGTLVAARNGSPLIIGVGDGEFFVASDASAIISYTKKVIYLDDKEVAKMTRGEIKLSSLDNKIVKKAISEVDWNLDAIEKGESDHFMLKEIYEQPETIKNTMRGRLDLIKGDVHLGGPYLSARDIRQLNKIIITACGTAWHAGLIGEYLIEEYAKIPVEVEYASELRYRSPIVCKNDLLIVISQSGETADTLAALHEINRLGAKSIGIVNTVGSTIARETNAGGMYIHAGPEIGVASTKTFTAQVTALALLTLFLGDFCGVNPLERQKVVKELNKIPAKVKDILKLNNQIKRLAQKYYNYKNFLYLGRGINFPIALEGALKLKEISYIHAEGYPSAEMKHGPIALIDENFPCVFIAPSDALYDKSISNIAEVKARKGKIISVATEGDKEIKKYSNEVIYIPKTIDLLYPLLTVIPLQLFAYHCAVLRGCDVDKPRNLAKSVTVE
jgi:glucosamine--fructose-6-phosphate aminotransferase (isomerizing)